MTRKNKPSGKNGPASSGVGRKPASLSKADVRLLMSHIDKVWEIYYADLLANERYEDQGIRIFISEPVLTEAVLTAISDLDRMMQFHFEIDGGADRHKFAAFLSRWIAKFRPVQFWVDEKVPESAELYELNAVFAMYVFSSFLTAPIPEPVFESLIYTFHYRDLSGEALSILAYSCEEAGSQMMKNRRLEEENRELKKKLKTSSRKSGVRS